MKRFLTIMALLYAGLGVALAANVTPTPIVGPTETGENSLGAQQVTDFARIKIGSCTTTTTGAEPSFSATCNGASGAITTNTNVTKVSGAVDLITVTNSKIQAGDFVQCTVDNTGAAAAAAAICSAAAVSTNQVIFQITNASATSPAHTLTIYFLVMTQGNPN